MWTAGVRRRIPGASTELLAIDRANELHSARVRGRPWHRARGPPPLPGQRRDRDRVPSRPAHDQCQLRASPACPGASPRRCAAPRRAALPPRLRHARLAERYRGLIERRGFPLPSGYQARQPPSERSAPPWRPIPSRACPATTTSWPTTTSSRGTGCGWWTGSTAATATRPSSSGTRCRELDYDDGPVRELCQAYFGRAAGSLVARVRLHMIVSDVGWTLWAAIQTAISRIAFDFAGLRRRALGARRNGHGFHRLRRAGWTPPPDPAPAAVPVTSRCRAPPLTTLRRRTHRRPSPRGQAPNPRRDT